MLLAFAFKIYELKYTCGSELREGCWQCKWASLYLWLTWFLPPWVKERLNASTGVVTHFFQTDPGLHNTTFILLAGGREGEEKQNNKKVLGWEETWLIQWLYIRITVTSPEVPTRRQGVLGGVAAPGFWWQIQVLSRFSKLFFQSQKHNRYKFRSVFMVTRSMFLLTKELFFYFFPILQKSTRFLKKRWGLSVVWLPLPSGRVQTWFWEKIISLSKGKTGNKSLPALRAFWHSLFRKAGKPFQKSKWEGEGFPVLYDSDAIWEAAA